MVRRRILFRTASENSAATSHQNPRLHRLVGVDGVDDAINDQLGDPQKPNRQERCKYAREQSKHDNPGAGVPHDLQDGWNIAERGDALLPSSPEVLSFRHAWFLPSLSGFCCRTDEAPKRVSRSMTVQPLRMQRPHTRCRNLVRGLSQRIAVLRLAHEPPS